MTNFLEKNADDSFFLRVNVKPNSKKQSILVDGNYLTITVCSKALQNKANKELLSLLRKKLKIPSNQINIVSGLKNKNKTVKLLFITSIDEKEVIEKLLS